MRAAAVIRQPPHYQLGKSVALPACHLPIRDLQGS